MEHIAPENVPAEAQLIDVREPDEYAAGHARGAVNIPMSQFVIRASEIDTTRPAYLICAAGGRSAQCGQYLEQSRGAEVLNVTGGTSAWAAQGLPMVD